MSKAHLTFAESMSIGNFAVYSQTYLVFFSFDPPTSVATLICSNIF